MLCTIRFSVCAGIIHVFSPDGSKLYSDSKFDYYKVRVAPGERMGGGATTPACRKYGLQAVCYGQGDNCFHNGDGTK